MQTSSVQSSENSFFSWETLNRAARFASSASFGYWLRPTIFNATRYGLDAALVYAPRLAIDAACAGASYGHGETMLSAALDATCLATSAASLATWTALAINHAGWTNWLIWARIAIDGTQITLAAKRLYDYYQSRQTEKAA